MMTDRHQLFSLCIIQGKWGSRGKRHICFQYAGITRNSKDISETQD